MQALLIISVLINIVFIWIIYNLYIQNNKWVEIVNQYFKKEDDFIKHYQVVLNLCLEAKLNMERIDKLGAFASDDDVGFSFKLIQSTIDTLAEKLNQIENEQKEKD